MSNRSKRGILAVVALLAVALVGGCFLLPNRPPEASFVVDYGVEPGDPMVVVLDASSSTDPDGDPIVEFLWTFGDPDVDILTPLASSAFVQTPAIRVRYPNEGTYEVGLLVRDDQGNSSAPISKSIVLPNETVGPTE